MWNLWEESWPIQCCAQNVKTGFMADVQKQRELPNAYFVCSKCKRIMEGMVDLIKKLCDKVETVQGFCYLGIRLNSSGSCEAAVTARVRIGWIRFRECRELLLGNRSPLRMKDKLYRCCIRSATLYGSEAWCLKNEKAISKRRESYGESHVWSESC